MKNELWYCLDNEIGSMDKDRIVLIPVGSLEPHGHLPLGVDTFIPAHILAQVAGRTGNTLLFPALPVGYNFKYADWPGSVSLSFATLRGVFADIFKEVARQGFKRIFVMSGHDENREAVVSAAGESMQAIEGLRVVYCDWIDLGISMVKALSESKQEGHASEIQTSVFQFLFPAYRLEIPQNETEAEAGNEGFKDDIFAGAEIGFWLKKAERGQKRSSYGNAGAAHPQKGEIIIEYIINQAIKVVSLLSRES